MVDIRGAFELNALNIESIPGFMVSALDKSPILAAFKENTLF